MTEPVSIPSPGGATRLFAVIGDPVAQVQAPMLMNRAFAASGMDAVLVPFHIAPADLDVAVEGLKRIRNLDGILITVPHKFAVCRLVDRLMPAAELAGSANALRRETDGTWTADNFDGAGFCAGLIRAGHDPRRQTVVLVGAGGAGAAIAPALLGAGVSRLHVTDISRQRAEALVTRLERRWPGQVALTTTGSLPTADLVVNATPLGLKPDDELPFDPAHLCAGTLVADIIMKPPKTKLLRAAVQRGLAVHPGLHMLEEQIGLYQEFFRP